jgi:heme oxygenase (biliverdin-producing, ferredoxin)
MRASTARQHALAERSGIVAAILSGRASRTGYALYLRNLLPAYRSMEQALERREALAAIRQLAQPALYRADRINADLVALIGPKWSDRVPLLPSGDRYAARVKWAGAGDGGKLIAHAYTRYLGDLSGGQILRRRLTQQFGPGFPMAFTEFPTISEFGEFAAAFRAALDRAASHVTDEAPVLQEASIAFQLNIELSQEVDAATHEVDGNLDIATM